jgi:hypothetical protein
MDTSPPHPLGMEAVRFPRLTESEAKKQFDLLITAETLNRRIACPTHDQK